MVKSIASDILEVTSSLAEGLRSMIQQIPPDILEAFVWFVKAQPEDLGCCWKRLANHGWFPYPSMLIGSNLLAKNIDGNPDAIDKVFMQVFRENLCVIEKGLVGLYPKREHFLRDAFEAHRRGKYSLSIPTFFSQADGVWNDRHSKSVFREQQREITSIKLTPQESNSIYSSFLPLFFAKNLPLWVTENERSDSFQGLNRHLVLHGISVDYDTEKNSLKSVSFLSWLSVILNHAPIQRSCTQD